MKKIVVSFSLLCSISSYAMEQDFLSAKQVSSLRKRLEEDAAGAEKLRENHCLTNCAEQAHRLLQQYHPSGAVSNPHELKKMHKEVLEICTLMDDAQAMYNGMIWASEIKETVVESSTVKELLRKTQTDSENFPLSNIQLLLQYSKRAIEILEENDSEKIFLNNYIIGTDLPEKESIQAKYYMSMLVPLQNDGALNTQIKKLFGYHVSMLLAYQMMNDLADTESTEEFSTESFASDVSDEE